MFSDGENILDAELPAVKQQNSLSVRDLVTPPEEEEYTGPKPYRPPLTADAAGPAEGPPLSVLKNIQRKAQPLATKFDQRKVGNVAFISYHGHVGSTLLMDALNRAYGMRSVGELFSSAEDSADDEYAEVASSNRKTAPHMSDVELRYRIKSRLKHKRGMVLSVRMKDAWMHGLSVAELLTALYEQGSITHVIFTHRNPLRARITEDMTGKYYSQLSHENDCEDLRYMFEISRKKALEMVLSQYQGFEEAIAVQGVAQLGLTYERDILPDINIALEKVVDFIGLQFTTNIEYRPHYHCPLSMLLYNYKELACVFRDSPLEYVINESEHDDGSFEDAMNAVKTYLVWDGMVAGTQKSLTYMNKCNYSPDAQVLAEYTMPWKRTEQRCGHGGHTNKCVGYGKVREYMCSKLLEINNGECNTLTYTNGECYLHDNRKEDYWTGDCTGKNSYLAVVN